MNTKVNSIFLENENNLCGPFDQNQIKKRDLVTKEELTSLIEKRIQMCSRNASITPQIRISKCWKEIFIQFDLILVDLDKKDSPILKEKFLKLVADFSTTQSDIDIFYLSLNNTKNEAKIYLNLREIVDSCMKYLEFIGKKSRKRQNDNCLSLVPLTNLINYLKNDLKTELLAFNKIPITSKKYTKHFIDYFSLKLI
jgi:hypothetical protein